jgi:holo-[acyl-carrier protein] synthase
VTVPTAAVPGLSGRAAGGVLIGIGIDSVDIERFAALLRRRPTLAERVFTGRERDDAARLVNPAPSLAGRFAAKEAVMKSLGVGLGAFGWADVEVRRRPGGAPELAVGGRAARLAADQGVTSWRLSITHTALTASAVVAALA